MPGKAAKVTITERQQEVLVEFRSAHTGERYLAQRAPIILWDATPLPEATPAADEP